MPSLTQPSVLSTIPLIDRTRLMPRLLTHHPTPDPDDAYAVMAFPDGTILPWTEVRDLTGLATQADAAKWHAEALERWR